MNISSRMSKLFIKILLYLHGYLDLFNTLLNKTVVIKYFDISCFLITLYMLNYFNEIPYQMYSIGQQQDTVYLKTYFLY